MRERLHRGCIALVVMAVVTLSAAPARADRLESLVQQARSDFIEQDPGMAAFFEDAHAYALFPRIKKGAIGIGGAHGKGLVYRGGDKVGRASLSQATIGFQLGGQVYSEVIFFEDAASFEDFRQGRFELSAQASAIAAAAGVAANARYDRGVAIFTIAQGGLMYEASVGGQKFTYEPL